MNIHPCYALGYRLTSNQDKTAEDGTWPVASLSLNGFYNADCWEPGLQFCKEPWFLRPERRALGSAVVPH